MAEDSTNAGCFFIRLQKTRLYTILRATFITYYFQVEWK